MASRAALVREADLRRMAKVAREEGVSIRGRMDVAGGFSFTIDAHTGKPSDDDGDLDKRLAAFGAK